MTDAETLSIASQTEAAQARLASLARRTPLLRVPELESPEGGAVLLKLENLQRTGSFKIRGAFNALIGLRSSIPASGVVAFSSGNHGIAVAEAARALGVVATIVAPADAPQIKLAAIREREATVITYDRRRECRETIARELARQTGALLLPAYDHPSIIAGQGTVAAEMREQALRQGCPVDTLLVPCGGGGLIAGCTMPLTGDPVRILAVEPEDFDDTARSLAAGRRLPVRPGGNTLCDSLMTAEPGAVTFPINRERLAGALVVSDEEVLDAIAYAWRQLRIIVEPGGAVALAALLAGKVECAGRNVAVVISGGNIDPEVLELALRR